MRRVLLVCLGNICRSPMADALLRHKLKERGIADRYEVDSAGTGGWHAGEAPDPRTVAELRRRAVQPVGSARRVEDADFRRFDPILAMDASNLRDLASRCPKDQAHRLAMALEPTGGGDVPDPYYGGDGGFARVYDMLDAALDAWIDRWEEG